MMIVIEKSPNCGNDDGHDGDVGGDDDDDDESETLSRNPLSDVSSCK